MKAKVLVVGVTCAAALAAAVTMRGDRDPAAPPPVPAAAKASRPPATTPETPLASPAASAALRHFRVSSTAIPGGGADVRGDGYSARVEPAGLDYRSGELRVRLRAATVEAGAAVFPVSALGTAVREAAHRARIERGFIAEEYVFENSRVEQLFHIPSPLGAGELRVRVDVQTDVRGPVEQVRRRQQGWKDTTLWDGGLVFKDEDRRPVFAYHGAVAIDASGRRFEIDPRYEGGQIVLEVPDAWMARASYPVVVDPWLENLFSASGGGISSTSSVSESPSVILDGSGNPIVAFSDKSSGNFDIYVRRFNGFEWFDVGPGGGTGGVSANPGESSHPSLALDTAGTLYVAWQDDSRGDFEIYVRRFDVSTWVELAGSATLGGISKNNGLSLFPSMATVNVIRDFFLAPEIIDNVPVVAWQNDSGGFSEIFLAVYFPGDDDAPEGWYGLPNELPGVVSPNVNSRLASGISATPISVSDRPKLAIDPLGRPWVAWSDTANNNYEIYLRGVRPGDAFLGATGQITVTSMLFWVDGGFSGVGGVSTGVFTFDDSGTGSFSRDPILWGEVDASATGGGISGQVPGPSPGLSLHPALGIDMTTGDLFVAWQESSSGAINSPTDIFAARIPVATPHTPANDAVYGAWATLVGGANAGSNGNAVSPSIAVRASFGGGNPASVYVAWQDDESGNPEIYVRRNTGGGWTDVGDLGSSFPGTPGGISNTADLSFTPSIAVNALDQPIVAWADGALGAFDVYVRRFYPNEVMSLSQADSAGALAPGDFTADTTVLLSGRVFSESGLTPDALTGGVRMQVEVREIGTPFTGTPTGETVLVQPDTYGAVPDPVAGSAIVTYSFSGAPNVKYKWRARSIDMIGRASAWISFGGNAEDAVDFEVRAPVVLAVPSNLEQRRSSDGVIIPTGGTVNENGIRLEGFITPPDASTTVQLEVEVVEGASNPFGTGTLLQSLPQSSSGVGFVIFSAPSNTTYKWRARTISSTGGQTTFVEYPWNLPPSDPDFVVQSPIPTALDQRLPDGTTPIPVGGQIGVDNLTFVATVTSPSPALQVQLEVELKPIGTPFNGGGLIQGALVNSGTTVVLPSGPILAGSYHWRARTRTSTGLTSAFVSFGANADGQVDFIFGVPGTVVGGTGGKKKKCGLTGLEVLLALAALGVRRRLTRRG